MSEMDVKHRGRLAQTGIYLGKLLRMFVYQNDWKVLPMGAFIAAVVTFVVGANMFVTQEGTFNGAFSLTCVCIWNGFFNSIQVICRERPILKREHRAGLHITAYVASHMVYQLLLCAAQAAITLFICNLVGVKFPTQGVVTRWGVVDMGITLLLTIYAADMFALMISALVHTTTAAMTVMPFMLIFQLVFSGAIFNLEGFAQKLTSLTISRWGMESICAIGRYNEQPMVTLWNTLFKFRNVEYMGTKPILSVMQKIEEEGKMGEFLQWSGQNNQNAAFASEAGNLLLNWRALVGLLLFAVIVAVISLKFIDRDKR